METFAIDAETFLIRPGLLAPPLVSVQAYDGKEKVLLNHLAGALWFAGKLREGACFVGANIAYDLAVLCEYNHDLIPDVFAAYEQNRIIDVQVAQMLRDIEAGCLHFPRHDGTKGYSLASLEKHYLGRDRSEVKDDPNGWRMRYSELVDVPVSEWPEAASKYALDDVVGTWEVFQAQRSADVVDLFPQVRAAWALHLACIWGIRTEKAAVDELEKKLLAERARGRKWLLRAGFYKERRATKAEVDKGEVDRWETTAKGQRPLKLAKNMEVIQATVEKHYKRRKVVAPKTDSGKKVATDRDTLEQSGSRILKALAEMGAIDKLLTTYIPVLRQGTEVPITSRANVLVESGRTSWSSPNLQQLPSGKVIGGVREAFIARRGFLFLSCDWNSAELRAIASNNIRFFGKSKLAELFREGKDVLSQLAADSLKIPYEQFDKTGAQEKKTRNLMKVNAYGRFGGLGDKTFKEYARGYGLNLTLEEAKQTGREFYSVLPEARAYLDLVGKVTRQGPTTVTSFVSGRRRGDVEYTQLSNHMFQSLVADAGKSVMFQLAKECYAVPDSPLFGSRLLVWVHDEAVLEVPEDCAHEAAKRVEQLMVEHLEKYTEGVPAAAEAVLMRRWFKAAEPVYRDGRLCAWEPKAAA